MLRLWHRNESLADNWEVVSIVLGGLWMCFALEPYIWLRRHWPSLIGRIKGWVTSTFPRSSGRFMRRN